MSEDGYHSGDVLQKKVGAVTSDDIAGGTTGGTVRPLTNSVMDLQMSIRALVNERRELQSRLATGKGRARTSGHAGSGARGIKRERAVFDETLQGGVSHSAPSKRLGAPSTFPKAASTTLDVSPDAFPVEKRPKLALDDSSIKRNRNLFGSLLGHLKKAKTCLDSEKTTKTAELQRLAEQQVSQKLDLERRNLAELRRRDFQDRQRRDLARMRDLQRELHMKETEILSLNLQNHFNLMKNFIRTDTTPMIFWIPVVHNDETKRLQELTRAQIESKVDSLVVKFTVPSEGSAEGTQYSGWMQDEQLPLTDNTTVQQPVKEPQTTVVPAVHPDLINDSDEEEDDHDHLMGHHESSSSSSSSSNDNSTAEPVTMDVDPTAESVRSSPSFDAKSAKLELNGEECGQGGPIVQDSVPNDISDSPAQDTEVTAHTSETKDDTMEDIRDVVETDTTTLDNSQPTADESTNNKDASETEERGLGHLRSMLVRELQQELKALGLSTSGRKDDLVSRLATALGIPNTDEH